ncbi:MAG: hypothetical protein R3B81_04950 [bacterium]
MTSERSEAVSVLLHVVDVLDRLRIPYHVGGSFASSVHGTPRQTQDVDIVVDLAPSAVDDLVEAFSGDFYADAGAARDAIRERSTFNLIHFGTGMKIDFFLLGTTPFDRSEFERGRLENIGVGTDRPVRIKSAEDTILRKLRWYRDGGEMSDRQWTDVVGIVRAQGERLDHPYLEYWAGELGVRDLLARLMT